MLYYFDNFFFNLYICSLLIMFVLFLLVSNYIFFKFFFRDEARFQ